MRMDAAVKVGHTCLGYCLTGITAAVEGRTAHICQSEAFLHTRGDLMEFIVGSACE